MNILLEVLCSTVFLPRIVPCGGVDWGHHSMINFIKWACNESPAWVLVPFLIAAVYIVLASTVIVVMLFFKGHYLAASAVTIVAPLAFTYYQYRKHTNAQ